jgi:hypothetical protein
VALLILAAALPLGAQAPRPEVKVARTPTAKALKVYPGILKLYVTPTPRPTVPSIEGRSPEEAARLVRHLEAILVPAGSEPSDRYSPGVIARQTPSAGEALPPRQRLVLRYWISTGPPPVTVAAPTLTPTPIDTATPAPTATPMPTATAVPEPATPTPTPARVKERPTRLPPVERPRGPTPTPPPPPPIVSWLVVAGLAALAAAAWLALRRRPPTGRTKGRAGGPDVELVPHTDGGTQEVTSLASLTSGLTLHAVVDPGEQTLEVQGPLLEEGKKP